MSHHNEQGECRYWDASSERYVTVEFIARRSAAGYGPGPEYRVAYCLAPHRWLNGVRHTDRGDLMTDVHEATKPWVK